jgi:serine/threonine protein kinase/tetratricopeptide (TPR) repeat protein
MSKESERTCPSCGNELSGAMEFCPVCLLREGLAGGVESGESSFEEAARPTAVQALQRFEHYELLRSEDGKPVELGRGAMGITYKAFDVNLRCPVTLKVISERYLGDESMRLRFLREARAAAKVRHANVASVFHLGRSSGDYFYAMEFVEGETLESLIQRSGRLEAKLALEIASQVAAGLEAVHEQKLVHRDIKSTNIMVRLKDEGRVTAKIIDLGLAKGAGEPGTESAISTPGAFAGTPEFASPEQFAGIQVDIRSDLYSLGVTLWEVLAGRVPFRGSPSEVMHQHQHAPLPVGQLKDVPGPVVVLLEALLEKDPARRFQNPTELLNAMPTVTDALDRGRRIARHSLQRTPSTAPRIGTRKSLARLRPEKISLARLPVTGSNVFGREEDIAFLDNAWANQDVNVVTIVAWAGVGKSTLVNHWLRRMAAEHYRSAQLVFGWSFYRQGSSGETSSADEFLDAALTWFGDPDPRLGTGWEKGEKLARLVSQRRTLLVLDGLEPLQNPPGPQEGRLREPSLQALLRELAAFNTGLCVITTRTLVADIAEHDGSAVLNRDLEQLSSDAGANLLRALGVKGDEVELGKASDEFSGHCLALTLLGSYLTDAYNGDVRCCSEVSRHLADDIRQGVHARKVMQSYQTWFGEGPELSVLRLLGLFDRPADERALGALLKPPAIPGVSDSLTDLRAPSWRTIIAKLRRARLLAGQDPHNPGDLDTHPLVREYFGEQLRSQRSEAWKECNKRLYHHYRTLAPQLPETFRDMEPLFLAVICGCNAGLLLEALRDVYIPRIQRGNISFAANVLSARGALLSALAHFFEREDWGSPFETSAEGQRLTAEDQLFIFMQAGQYLTATRGPASSEARICYKRAESLCYSLDRPLSLHEALMGQWHHSLNTDILPATMQIAQRLYSLAKEQENAALMIGACNALGITLFFLGDFETARKYLGQGLELWHSGGVPAFVEEVEVRAVSCLCYKADCDWHLGEIASSRATIVEAICLAKELNNRHGLAEALAEALASAASLGHSERNPAEVERCASDLIELATPHRLAHWRAVGAIYYGWARSASGDTAGGIAWIEDGIRRWRATGAMLVMPVWLMLNAEALHFAGHSREALEAIKKAEALIERSDEREWCAELYRLRGVFLAAIGADEVQIEDSYCEAIRIAREQKAISLENRAEATYAEYRRQKASTSGGGGFRLPLC